MSRRVRVRSASALLAMLSGAQVLAGQAPERPTAGNRTPSAQSPADPATKARAIQLLQRHAERSKAVKVLVADYVQRRTTTLSKRPLVSSGSFLFVKKPACVVFRAAKPRVSIVRLTPSLYEVFRPRHKRLEKFELHGPELAMGLFAALGGDADRLLRDFEVRGLLPMVAVEGAQVSPDARHVPDAAEVTIQLVPKAKLVRERLRELLITLHGERATLSGVSYRDHSGDLVQIELHRLRPNPKNAPAVAFDVLKDTKVVVHKLAKQRVAKPKVGR